MNKLFHVLNIVFFTVGITLFVFGSPVVVRASDFIPYIDTGSLSVSYDIDPPILVNTGRTANYSFFSTPYGVYFERYVDETHTIPMVIAFNVGAGPSVTRNHFDSANHGSFTYEYNGTVYNVYWYSYYCYITEGSVVNYDGQTYTVSYPSTITGTKVNSDFLYNNDLCTAITKFFLFGEGNFDYEQPAQDIVDADLDIKGLSAYILNDFQATPDYIATAKNAWKEFYLWSMNKLTGQIFDDSFVPIDLQDPISGTTKYFVPGVALSWFSPTLDNDTIYNIWIDGVSDIKYKTSSNIIDNFFNTQRLDTISYGKLKINDNSLSQNLSVYYQYNTAQAVDVILNYIQNNALATSPVQIDTYNYISLDTKISRVYIQASKVIDGENHIGALSYVDIVGGVPVVHEGITSIDDVTASDPSTGTPAIVGSTSVVSGDTIYGGDTYFDNSTTNYITTGLVVGGGDPLSALAAVKKLFSAIFELVQALYLTKLIKWILVGFTGNPLGDLIL